MIKMKRQKNRVKNLTFFLKVDVKNSNVYTNNNVRSAV